MEPRPRLFSDDVLAAVRSHATVVPLTTGEIARYTRLTYPFHAVDHLAERGITTPQGRSRYWALPGGA